MIRNGFLQLVPRVCAKGGLIHRLIGFILLCIDDIPKSQTEDGSKKGVRLSRTHNRNSRLRVEVIRILLGYLPGNLKEFFCQFRQRHFEIQRNPIVK